MELERLKEAENVVEDSDLESTDGAEKAMEKKKELTPAEKAMIAKTSNVVMIRGLPHGFYEEALFGFLSQYGRVKNVFVPRSAKTGKVRGHAFVQFQRKAVAEQVAFEMHGYYIKGQVLKADLKPAETVNPNWHDNMDRINMDKRIRLYGMPRERLRLPRENVSNVGPKYAL